MDKLLTMLFSKQGRINRLQYLGYSLLLTIFMLAILLIADYFSGGNFENSENPIVVTLVFLLYLVVLYSSIILAIKRFHDINASGWWAILIVIPLVPLVMLFIPGTKGPNNFGNPP